MILTPARSMWLILLVIVVVLWLAIPIANRWIYPLKYEQYILQSSQLTQTDPFLIMAIIRVESKFDPYELSRAGAQGLMQLMPETVHSAIENGKFPPSFRDYVHDPRMNIRMGSWYLSVLNKQFRGNKIAVIAAYNAGPGKVKKWLQRGVWDGTRKNVQQIPYGQTRHYVQRVTFFYQKYKEVYQDVYRDLVVQ